MEGAGSGPLSIVAAYNGTEACRTAVRRAAALALRMRATLHVVSVQAMTPVLGGTAWAVPYEALEPSRDAVRQRAQEGAALVQEAVDAVPNPRFGVPAVEIVRVAEETGAHLVVLGRSAHTKLERFLLGSTADRVLRLSPVPCLVAASPQVARRILVALDDSHFGAAALRAALRYAADTGAALRCVHVVPASGRQREGERAAEVAIPAVRGYFEGFVRRLCDEAAAAGVPPVADLTTAVRSGEAGPEILREAEAWAADLVASGSHGRGFLERAILGSTSEYLVRHAGSSVLVVPAAAT